MKIELDIRKETLDIVVKILGEMAIENTENLIDDLGIDIDVAMADIAIYNLYSELYDELENEKQRLTKK